MTSSARSICGGCVEHTQRVLTAQVEGYEIVRVSGAVAYNDESAIPTLATPLSGVAMVNSSGAPALAPLFLAPSALDTSAAALVDGDGDASERTLPPLPPSLWIGDLKLAALKRRLAAASIPAAFAGEGVLVCGPVQPAATTATAGADKGKTAVGKTRADPRRRVTAASIKTDVGTPEPEAAANSNDRVAVRKQAEGQLLI